MKISAQAQVIVGGLAGWATSDGGKAFIASDLVHLWEIAYQTTQGTRAILLYNGEDIRGDFSVAAALGRVDRKWILAITRGRGFAAQRGDSLIKTVQNARPLFDLAEEARDIIRSMLNISVESPVDYKSIETLGQIDPEKLVDVYLIHFSTANDLPMMTADGDGNVVIIYQSSVQSYTATCPQGETGTPVTVSSTEGQFTSLTSQEEADALALSWATEQATSQLVCENAGCAGVGEAHEWLNLYAPSNLSFIIGSIVDEDARKSTDNGETWSALTEKGLRVGGSPSGGRLILLGNTIWDPTATTNLISTDNGATWSPEAFASGGGNPTGGIGFATDSVYLLSYDNGLYRTINSGSNWSLVSGIPAFTKMAFASSTTARGIGVLMNTLGARVYRTVNTGGAWAAVGPTGVFFGLCISGDGTRMFSIEAAGIYRSTDSGSNWSLVLAQSCNSPSGVGCSADGLTVVSAINADLLRVSYDGGDTWEALCPNENGYSDVVVSADGTRAVAMVRPTDIYTFDLT